jgi:multiple sugar transport system substrate-binding protein
MKRRKAGAWILSALLAISALTGCGGAKTAPADQAEGSMTAAPAEETAPAAEKVTLQYYDWSDEEPYLTEVVSQFNAANPNIEIKMNIIPSNDYDDKIKVLLSGNEADIMGIRTVGQVAQFAEAQYIPDLTDKINGSGIDVTAYGSMFQKAAVDGKFYALPTRSSQWMLFYNKDIFDKEGLPYPTQMTWDQYADLAKQLTKGEGDSKQWGGYMVNWILQFQSVQHGVYLTDDDLTYDRQGLEFLNRIYNADKSHMSYVDMKANNSDVNAEFEKGNVAMMMNGEWEISMLLNDAAAGKHNVNWEVAPIPVPEGVENGTTWGQFAFASVSAQSKYQDQGFEYVKYLCGPEGSRILARKSIIPAYRNEENQNEFVKATGKDSLKSLFSAKVIQEQPTISSFTQVLAAFNEHADLYLIGEKTLDETMKNFEAQRAEILAKK